jgi:protease I
LPAFVKAQKTYDEQVDLLASRGLVIGDRHAAINQLKHINYYRLSGYLYPFSRQAPSDREDSF